MSNLGSRPGPASVKKWEEKLKKKVLQEVIHVRVGQELKEKIEAETRDHIIESLNTGKTGHLDNKSLQARRAMERGFGLADDPKDWVVWAVETADKQGMFETLARTVLEEWRRRRDVAG